MLRRIGSVLFLLILMCVSGQAQDVGRISGTVQDPTGAVITGAAVIATEAGTGFTQRTISNETGTYVFPSLRPTVYAISAEAPGFRRYSQSGVEVLASARITLNLVLQLGDVTELVEVQANAVQVNTTSSELSEVVDRARIADLVLNGRNILLLSAMAPGTVLQGVSAENAKAIPGGLELSANGTPGGQQTSYKLDGANNTDIYFQRSNSFPFPDAVQEFSIQTSNYSATTGGNAGAMVNVVTRSGTNEFHGGAFEFVRNRKFNARSFFARDVDNLKRNQFGAYVGGPIVSNKTFFFFGWQQNQLRDIRAALTAFAPTTDMKNGIFSTCGAPCEDTRLPALKDPLGGTFANKQIPVTRFDPAAVNVAKLIPAVGGDGFMTIPRPANQHQNQFITRVDHMATDNDRISGRYFVDHFENAGTFDPSNILSYRNPTLASRVRNQNAMVGWQKTFSPTVLNDFQFSYAKNHAARGPYFDGAPSMRDLGVRLPIYPTLPSISEIQSIGFFNIGDNLEAQFPRDSFTWTNRTSIIRGSHSVQFGGESAFQRVGIINEFRRAGHFQFNGGITGLAQADFFLGSLFNFDQGTGEYKDFRANRLSFYFQDDWKATSRLTINMGIRYEPTAPWKEILGRFEKFRIEDYNNGVRTSQFTNAPAGITYLGDPGVPEWGTNPDNNNWGGRFGFAYALTADGRTSLRGGAGMFYDVQQLGEFNNDAVNAPPFSLRLNVRNPQGPFADPYRGRTDFDTITVEAIGSRDAPFPRPVLAATFDERYETPLQYNWNLTLEREILPDWLARAGYVGSASNYGRRTFQLNAADSNVATGGTDARRIFAAGGIGSLNMYTEDRRSNYHSMQVSLQKRFSQGFTFRATHTWSRALGDYGVDSRGNEVVPWFAPATVDRLLYGPLDIHRAHRFVLSWVWDLPTTNSANAVVRQIVNGWQWSGLGQFQTGQPYTITSGQDNSRDGIGNDRAIHTGADIAPAAGADKRVAFNPAAFAVNPSNTYGTVGAGAFTGPHIYSYDMGIFKNFRITERVNLQFRSEYFNIFNQVNFRNPESNVSGGGFGSSTAVHAIAGDPRILQFGLKLTF